MATMTVDAMQVGHSANMVAALADHLENDDLPKHVRHACGDAFMVHARLLAGWALLSGTFDRDDLEWLEGLIEDTEQHVTAYGDERHVRPLVRFDLSEIAERVLRLALDAADEVEPVTSYIAAAIAGDWPRGF